MLLPLAAIAVTPLSPLGTLHWPELSLPQPQATTVPSLFSARLWNVPAATAITPERPLGTVHCPPAAKPPQPQATTVPLPVACAAPAGKSRRTPSAASVLNLAAALSPLAALSRGVARLSRSPGPISRRANGGARGTRADR